VSFVDLAAEVATEVRLIRAIEAELAGHAAERETAYRWADPGQFARTLPGLGEVGSPVLAAVIGEATRFPTGAHFKSYLGLTPRASETGDTDRKGQPMFKAGSRLLRSTLVRAADHARKQDPQMARIHYVQIVERGASHLKALCVVAARLAERAWAVMHRRMPYVICDTTGQPVTPAHAKQIIAAQWAVPADVRTHRRSRKTIKGKAPQQVHTGQDKPHARSAGKRGDLPRPRSSASNPNTSSTCPLRPTGETVRDEVAIR
jgi:Transposase IS116/IS110/IS902 family